MEQIGIERSMKALEEAELILIVLDASRPQDDEDRRLLDLTDVYKRQCLDCGEDMKQTREFFSVGNRQRGQADILICLARRINLDHQRIVNRDFRQL